MNTSASLISRLADPSLLSTECFVDGAWIGAGSGAFDVTSPSTGEVIASVPSLGGLKQLKPLRRHTPLSIVGRRAPQKSARISYCEIIVEKRYTLEVMAENAGY